MNPTLRCDIQQEKTELTGRYIQNAFSIITRLKDQENGQVPKVRYPLQRRVKLRFARAKGETRSLLTDGGAFNMSLCESNY